MLVLSISPVNNFHLHESIVYAKGKNESWKIKIKVKAIPGNNVRPYV